MITQRISRNWYRCTHNGRHHFGFTRQQATNKALARFSDKRGEH